MERLRDARPRDEPTAVVLAALDPAQPYGAALPWPARESGGTPKRQAGAQVVLVDGGPALYLERGGKGLLMLAEPGDERLAVAASALARWVTSDRRRRVRIERVDGAPTAESPEVRDALLEAGFREDLRGLSLRA